MNLYCICVCGYVVCICSVFLYLVVLCVFEACTCVFATCVVGFPKCYACVIYENVLFICLCFVKGALYSFGEEMIIRKIFLA